MRQPQTSSCDHGSSSGLPGRTFLHHSKTGSSSIGAAVGGPGGLEFLAACTLALASRLLGLRRPVVAVPARRRALTAGRLLGPRDACGNIGPRRFFLAIEAPQHIVVRVVSGRPLADTHPDAWEYLRSELADHRFHAIVRARTAALAQPQHAKR